MPNPTRPAVAAAIRSLAATSRRQRDRWVGQWMGFEFFYTGHLPADRPVPIVFVPDPAARAMADETLVELRRVGGARAFLICDEFALAATAMLLELLGHARTSDWSDGYCRAVPIVGRP